MKTVKNLTNSIHLVDGISNGHKVFKELAGHVLIDTVSPGQGQGDLQHDGAEEGHPRCGIRLHQVIPYRTQLHLKLTYCHK